MRATRTLAVVCGLVSALAGACGSGGAGGQDPATPVRAAALATGAEVVWADALGTGWEDWSWGSTRASTTSSVQSGTAALAVTFQTWGALYFRRVAGPSSGMASLDFWANGGSSAGNKINVQAVQGNSSLAPVSLSPYCTGGTIPAGAWTHCTVPLAKLTPAGGAIDGIVLQEVDGAARPTMYFDAVALLPAAAPATPAPSASVPVYADALASGWMDWSWGSTRNFAATSPVASGTRSLAVTFQGWGGLYFRRSAGSVTGATAIALSVNGGAAGGAPLQLRVVQGTTQLGSANLATYCTGGTIPANAWTRCSVPLSALAPAGTNVDGLILQYESATARTSPIYLDDVSLTVASSSQPAPPPPTPTLPAAPANLVASAASGAVSLSWGAVSGATGYVLSRATASAGPFTALTAAPQAGTTYRDGAVAAGTTYWYRVAAVNAAGTGPTSAAVSATVPTQTAVTVSVSPANATLDACTAAKFSATVTGTANQTVTWSVLEGAAGGTVDASGNYTAPGTAGTYHLVATSQAAGSPAGSVAIVVQDHILAVAMNPVTSSLRPGGTQQFTATVTTSCGTFTVAQ